MKKTMIMAVMGIFALNAAAQAVETPGFWDNWSAGIDAGITTTASKNFDNLTGNIRPALGVHFGKQVTPVFSVGAEMQAGINTSRWPGRVYSYTAFDNSYVGMWGQVNMLTLFQGYQCQTRPFDLGVVLGIGWGHDYKAGEKVAMPYGMNHVTGKFGLNFLFNLSDQWSLGIKPYALWNLSNGGQHLRMDSRTTSLNLMASLSYHFGGRKFECVTPYNQSEIDALNGQVNDLRAQLKNAAVKAAEQESLNAQLAQQLLECQNRPVEVVKEEIVNNTNTLNSVRYVFYGIGSSTITSAQAPNVEQIAQYMKNHPDSKVEIKGYASPDGNLDNNIRLANKRAQAVKDMLINRYKIASSRISAEGQGIGNMFSEESWNRVAICTIID